MNERIPHHRESGRGRRALRQAGQGRAREAARGAGWNWKCARRQARRSHGACARRVRARAAAISSPWAATAPPSRSSTDFSPRPRRADGRPWAFCRSAPAILSARFHRPWRGVRHRGDSCPAAAPLRRLAPQARRRRSLLHQYAEHGFRGRRRRRCQSPLQAAGRAGLYSRRAGLPGPAATAALFRFAWTMMPSSIAAAACSSPSATASLPAAR